MGMTFDPPGKPKPTLSSVIWCNKAMIRRELLPYLQFSDIAKVALLCKTTYQVVDCNTFKWPDEPTSNHF